MTPCTTDSAAAVAPDEPGPPGTVLLSGDDAGTERTTGRLLTGLGRPPPARPDTGGGTTARGREHFALLFTGPAGGPGTHAFDIDAVARRPRRARTDGRHRPRALHRESASPLFKFD
ncbi:hypothetical protein [Streptomyces griseomycini]|uniref:Uncharacterized protein n=1 Tax=Streptomyces griseomycini TaxID=66895 RepID=A0A7W7LVJ5_9ACTN|nr:hypothetical protein [Streptomyces griseomycini]MBB4896857.1 hypothetical protein [Streptomyces griseomycini]GGP87025.1 hypothetical protein GCM10010266_07280 [Streptomyces griseomycini]GGR15140.1 hypothetical protein GCM10015536_20870 [Streptomyces griseomycini]